MLLAVTALWVSHQWWLPHVPALLLFMKEQSDVFQAIDSILNIVWKLVLALGVIWGVIWLGLHWPRKQSDTARTEALLHPVTPEDIRNRMGRGGQVEWINRDATDVSSLQAHGRVMITGRMKIGKTREAAELVDRVLALDLVPKDRVFEPGPAFRVLSRESLIETLRGTIAPQSPALLFVDDLPFHYFGSGLNQLSDALDVLGECKNSYVVATARDDQLTEAHRDWLEEEGFQVMNLGELDAEETGRFLDAASDTFDLQMDDAARKEFVDGGDGTPESTLIGLRLLAAEGVTRIDSEIAHRVARESLVEAWSAARRYIQERQPVAKHFLSALATFHSARVAAYTPLVLHYANRLWLREDRWRWPWRRISTLRQALDYMAHFDITVKGDQIVYPDVALEGLVPPEDARQRLTLFLEGHRRVLHRCILRVLYRQAKPHAWALVNLALTAYYRNEKLSAIQLYSAALSVRPFLGLYNNRGNAYNDLGQTERAIEDYDKAIELNPEDATAYCNRGAAYAKLGQTERAIEDFDKAIELNPEDAAAYYNRGNAYDDLGQTERAIEDFDKAIELNPEFAAYYNRGNAYAKLGQTERAIEDYDKAIELNPEYATAYSNRAESLIRLGRLNEATADCRAAQRLAPDHPLTHAAWGRLAYAQGNHQAAAQRYKQATGLAPDPTQFNFKLALPLLCLGQAEEALAVVQARLDAHPQPEDLMSMLAEYEPLHDRQPELPGLAEALMLLRAAAGDE